MRARSGAGSRRAKVWVAAMAVILVGCSSPSPPADTGVEGIVTIGPMCPVVQVEQPCPDQPYAARLTVANPFGKIFTRATADADGRFRIPLPGGDYLLEAGAADGRPFPASASHPFSVREGVWTRLDVTLDSGIR